MLERAQPAKIAKTERTQSQFSSGATAASLTSTAAHVSTSNKFGVLDGTRALYALLDQSAYVQLVTNFGNLNFELYYELRPRTCHNFIGLARKCYYDGTLFHTLDTDYYVLCFGFE